MNFLIPNPEGSLLFDFGEGKIFGRWVIINDGVMGGMSDSNARLEKNAVVFYGHVSLENNGGFVSLRSPMGKYDLSSFSYCEMRFKSPSYRNFEILLERETAFYLPKFRKKFLAVSDDWEVVTFLLTDFEISRMGETTQKGIALSELQHIQRLGIILADKQEGDFELVIDYIKFF
ncbi:CIA30 family protein [Mongoliitalea daihaiensis]|uniref:CIA30 family protein n=1 Tax=Mongoliitalea daihaiensis TaxID=2782006 RepID=UPI001F240CF7|nr:CIA30 family protein [Mongoliitalea daihaiensis]UJP64203.1 CIA30 family protein [Mongoliitalea daihaiensis]